MNDPVPIVKQPKGRKYLTFKHRHTEEWGDICIDEHCSRNEELHAHIPEQRTY